MTSQVLYIINGDYYAGAERVQDLLALRLPELGYEVGFVCLKEGLFADKRKAKEIPLYRFPMRSRLDMRFVFRLARLARDEGYQLIHTHSTRAVLVGLIVSKITGLPMVHHLHSPTTDDTEAGWRNWRNTLAEKPGLLGARKIIPVSGSLERYLLARGVGHDRIRMVANGVPVREPACRQRVPGEPLVIGTVALFRPRKGLEVLLNALAHLKRGDHRVCLHAVGPFETREYREHIMGLVDELGLVGEICWTGFTEDVFAEFSKMHAFVLPSLFGEGMPMVILEAMSVGLPVVSTRVEGIPEVLREGKDGLLVEPDNVDGLADAIRKLVAGTVDGGTLGESGWRRQREFFSDLAMAEGVADVYREVLAESRT